mmetsp:Transcript_52854/g.139109  ORF Transcript_52854/g.139109 Transcript_52854/m.139109 type:complete len:330 (+) Transcript_52854:92-1081(+)
MAFHLTGLARAASAAPQTPSTTPSRTKSNEEYERKMPEEKFRMMDLEIGLLLNRTWQPRRFIMTRDALHFAFSRDDNEIDHIPLAEITNSGIMKDAEHGGTRASFSGPRRNSVSLASHGLYTIHIATENDGYNSGRVYYLQAESNEINDRLLLAIQENSKAARKRKASRNIWQVSFDSFASFVGLPLLIRSMYLIQRAQRRLNEWFNSTPVQAFVIAVISLVRNHVYSRSNNLRRSETAKRDSERVLLVSPFHCFQFGSANYRKVKFKYLLFSCRISVLQFYRRSSSTTSPTLVQSLIRRSGIASTSPSCSSSWPSLRSMHLQTGMSLS